ncbi:MAG: hypothetical protein EOM18_16215 [Clostridia bacterium]|nr:hypothetical protein [Clostridia bacterium]
MIIVSGISRSGTSLMMNCLHRTFGDSRIHGIKNPLEDTVEHLDKRYNDEPEHIFNCRKYLMRKNFRDIMTEFNKSKELNPTGFWETEYATQGVYYRFADRMNLKRWKEEPKPTFCKIVGRGLWQSDPTYIDKIIYMVRNPADIVKSHENLRRSTPIINNGNNSMRLEDMVHKANDPLMYMDVTGKVCEWFAEYPDIPVLYVYYDNLMDNPMKVFEDIREFIGEGDFTEAVKCIDSKLRRSVGERCTSKLWEMAWHIYDMFIKREYAAVVQYIRENHMAIHKPFRRWFCGRVNREVCFPECVACYSGRCLRMFKKTAEEERVDWKSEPCLYECGLGDLPEYKSIQDSIENNFWCNDGKCS